MALSCCLITWEQLAISSLSAIFFSSVLVPWWAHNSGYERLIYVYLLFSGTDRCPLSRWWVWRKNRQCATRRRGIRDDFHRPRQRWDVGKEPIFFLSDLFFWVVVFFFFSCRLISSSISDPSFIGEMVNNRTDWLLHSHQPSSSLACHVDDVVVDQDVAYRPDQCQSYMYTTLSTALCGYDWSADGATSTTIFLFFLKKECVDIMS